MGIIWSNVSLAEAAECVALRVWEVRTRRWKISEEANRTWFGGLRGKMLVVFICHLYTPMQGR